MVESAQAVQDWKKDKTIPLAQVVNGWKVFVTHKLAGPLMAYRNKTSADKDLRHGNQGVLDTASHGTLDEEFGTHKEEDVVMQILEKGDVQESAVRIFSRDAVLASLTAQQAKGRDGDRNQSKGSNAGH